MEIYGSDIGGVLHEKGSLDGRSLPRLAQDIAFATSNQSFGL
jgi:hypothetical protein